MLSISRKLGVPTGTLKQNFWGNEFSISWTQETHVSVLGTCSRFWKRKALLIRELLLRIFLDSGTLFPKLKIRFEFRDNFIYLFIYLFVFMLIHFFIYLFFFILLLLFCTVKSTILPFPFSETVQLLQNDAQNKSFWRLCVVFERLNWDWARVQF